MYRWIVARRIRRTFLEDLSSGNWRSVMRRTSPQVVQSFPGEGALAGTRSSREAVGRWFERLFRLFPVLHFEVDQVVVSGWPWRTNVAVRWRDWGLAADGEPYENAGCETFEIRWGRATRIDQYLDTNVIRDSLERMAARGIREAAAAPILGPGRAPARTETAVATGLGRE